MRKLLAFAALSMILVSCENQEVPATDENTEPTIIGSSIGDDGKSSPLVAGDTALEHLLGLLTDATLLSHLCNHPPRRHPVPSANLEHPRGLRPKIIRRLEL